MQKQKTKQNTHFNKSPKQHQQKKETVYAFIDSQNLNLGTQKNVSRMVKGRRRVIYRGWKLDFNKFRKYLTDKFRVSKAFLFIGYMEENQKLYDALTEWGYTLVYKPTVTDRDGKAKGNVDAELVLHASKIQYSNYDKAVIVSGDGDFFCLHEDLEKEGKLLKIILPNRHSESSLLDIFQDKKVFIDREKKKLAYK